MIYSLRKRHRYMWLTLAILLPVGFVAAIMAVPKTEAIETEFKARKPAAFAIPVSSAENESFLVNLRKSDNIPGFQVEIDIKKPLEHSNVTAYFSYTDTDNVANAGVIGRLTGTETHRFAIGTIAHNLKKFFILFYDSNKKEVFDVIKVEQEITD